MTQSLQAPFSNCTKSQATILGVKDGSLAGRQKHPGLVPRSKTMTQHNLEFCLLAHEAQGLDNPISTIR